MYFIVFKLIGGVGCLSEAWGLGYGRSLHHVVGLVEWFLSGMLGSAIVGGFRSCYSSWDLLLFWRLLLRLGGAGFCLTLVGLSFGCFRCRYCFAIQTVLLIRCDFALLFAWRFFIWLHFLFAVYVLLVRTLVVIGVFSLLLLFGTIRISDVGGLGCRPCSTLAALVVSSHVSVCIFGSWLWAGCQTALFLLLEGQKTHKLLLLHLTWDRSFLQGVLLLLDLILLIAISSIGPYLARRWKVTCLIRLQILLGVLWALQHLTTSEDLIILRQ